MFSISARESVGDGVEAAGVVFHREVVAEKFAHPLMLRDSEEPLVQQELQAVVVGTYSEDTSQKVWLPVTDRVDQTNELPLIRC